jgi:hypothetical protein
MNLPFFLLVYLADIIYRGVLDQSSTDPSGSWIHYTDLARAPPVFYAVSTLRIRISARLRHLAERYVLELDSFVGLVRLEPGPSCG